MSPRAPLAVAAVAAALCAAAPAGAQRPLSAPDTSRAAAAILMDARDGSIILDRGGGKRRAIASTTKLMTALLALERAKPDDLFTAPAYTALAVESKINLRKGERMRVQDLLEALLLESANDAAVTIAEGVSGSRQAFVRDMNARARQLGLRGTSYANPIGLDDPGNYSNARDLATLTRLLLRKKRFADIVDRPSSVLESGVRRRVVRNRNLLVGRFPFVDGVKTGHTRTAGYVLIGVGSGRLGARMISVVLGEPGEAARDADTLSLIRYGLSLFRRVKALDGDRAVARVAVKHRDERAALVPARDLLLTARRGQRVRTRVDVPDELEGELAAGTRVGRVAVVKDGKVVARVPVVTAGQVPGPGLAAITDRLGGTLTVVAVLFILTLAAIGGSRMRSRRRARELAERRRERNRARARAGG